MTDSTVHVFFEDMPSVVGLPLLFIPFEGNFNKGNMGGYQSRGNQTASIFELGSSKAQVIRGSDRLDDESMQSSVGSSSFWTDQKGDVSKKPLLSAAGKQGLMNLLLQMNMSAQEFYEIVAEDRLRQLGFTRYSSPENDGFPAVIVLSERLLDWPEELRLLGHAYRNRGQLGVGNLQDMAAFVLESTQLQLGFEVRCRSSRVKADSFTETWLLIREGQSRPPLTVACVHLSSKYTAVKTGEMDAHIEGLLSFARTAGIHAIMGDFNMNTYGVNGGAFPTSSEFVVANKRSGLKTTFATSSGSGTKAYMGGMICDPRVSFLPTLKTFGTHAIPPWFVGGRLDGNVFSDHHSLYGRYAFHGDAPRRWRAPPPDEGGGDCFFYALRRRLGRRNEDILTFRQGVIDAITRSVVAEPNMRAARSVLVQQPGDEGVALPQWCEGPADYMNEMRQQGRWLDDSLIPFIAQSLQRRFVIQYGGYHAVFETDGSRTDVLGDRVPADDTEIFMYCHGNHFW